MYDGRTVHARDVVATLVEQFGETVFDTVVSRTVKFPETTVAGEPILSYAPDSSAAESTLAPGPGVARPMTVTDGTAVPSAPPGGPVAAAKPAPFLISLVNFDGPFDLLLQLNSQAPDGRHRRRSARRHR